MQKKTTFSITISSIFLAANSAVASGSSGVSPSAYHLFDISGLPVTNAMATSWVFSLAVILAVKFFVKKPQMIPTKGQALLESYVEAIRDVVEPIVGKKMLKVTFPILIGFFTFILVHDWSGLIPGVGVFGWVAPDGHMTYWMRPGNADLNMTYALSLTCFAAWIYFVLKYAGIKALFLDLFGNKASKNDVPGILYFLLFFVFAFVGVIEIISIAFRNVSLPFRLFGNVFAGENLLTSITGLVGYIAPIPFYFLETLVGLVQALVFTLLTAVYIGLICNHDSGEH